IRHRNVTGVQTCALPICQVDVNHLLMPSAIQLRHVVGADVRVVSWTHTGGGALTVAPHVTEIGQLAGTQVAIPGWWSIHNMLLQRVLRAHGLTPVVRTSPSRSAGTVELVVMSPSDMIPALAKHGRTSCRGTAEKVEVKD